MKECEGCGKPLLGMRSDAKYHPSCRSEVRRKPLVGARNAFWDGVNAVRRKRPDRRRGGPRT